MKSVSLKQAIDIVFPNATNVKIVSGYNQRCAWFDLDGKTYNLFVDSVGSNLESEVCYREVKHRKDYTGGTNMWDFGYKLNDKGYRLNIPSKNCDFNSN